MFNSTPENEPRKIGSHLTWVAFAATCVTSSKFLTALTPDLLAAYIFQKTITQYATDPAPILYDSGFISQIRWWLLRLIFGGIHLAAMLEVTVIYI